MPLLLYKSCVYSLSFSFPFSLSPPSVLSLSLLFSLCLSALSLSLSLSLSPLPSLLQNFIFTTITNFGPLTCSIFTTTRKFFTFLGSVIIFNNPLLPRQWVGVVLVFIGLGLDVVFGKPTKRHLHHHHHHHGNQPEAPPPGTATTV